MSLLIRTSPKQGSTKACGLNKYFIFRNLCTASALTRSRAIASGEKKPPVIWDEKEFPEALYRDTPNSDLNKIVDFPYETFEEEISSHYLLESIDTSKANEHPVWRSRKIVVQYDYEQEIKSHKLTGQQWRPITKILNIYTPIYFEGRKYTSVMVQAMSLGFIKQMIDMPNSDEGVREREVIRVLQSVSPANVVLTEGQWPKFKKSECDSSKNHWEPIKNTSEENLEPFAPAGVFNGFKRLFLPSVLVKLLSYVVVPGTKMTDAVTFSNYVNTTKWLAAQHSIERIYKESKDNTTLMVYEKPHNAGLTPDFSKSALFAAMRGTEIVAGQVMTREIKNNHATAGFFLSRCLYFAIYSKSKNTEKVPDTLNDGNYIGVTYGRTQTIHARIMGHISKNTLVPTVVAVWNQLTDWNGHTPEDLESYIHTRMTEQMKGFFNVEGEWPAGAFDVYRAKISNASRTGFASDIPREVTIELCNTWINENDRFAGHWELVSPEEMAVGQLQINESVANKRSKGTQGLGNNLS